MTWVCQICGVPVSDGATCPKCGTSDPSPTPPPVKKATPSNHVVITGINIPFVSLVSLMVKLALASIPAGLILIIIYGIFAAALLHH